MDKDIIIKENFYTQLVSDTSVEGAILNNEKS